MSRTGTKIINYHTSGKDAPEIGNIELGEIAVQYNSDEPKLYIKNSDHDIVEFRDKQYNDETYIRTVNGTGPDSSGNVDVSGSGEVPVIQKGTSDTTFTIEPNKVYVWDTVTSLDISLATPSSESVVNHYFFQFISGPTATTLSLPDNVIYMGTSTIEANRKYQCSILFDVAKLGGAAYYTLEPIVDFNVSTAIGAVTASTGTLSYTVEDDQGNDVTFSIVGGGTRWSAQTGSYTYTLNGNSYTSTHQLMLSGAGSTTRACIQTTVTGPCTIYIAARRSGNTSPTISVYVGSTSVGTVSPTSQTSVTVSSLSYTGTGGTLYVYTSRPAFIYHIEIDYNI